MIIDALKVSLDEDGGAYGVEMLEDFEFDEDTAVGIISTILYSLSASLDEGVNKEQFEAEVLKKFRKELETGRLNSDFGQIE